MFEGHLEESTSNKRILLIMDGGKITKYRLVDLEKISLYETEIPAIWKGEEGKYQGVLLKDILSLAGVTDARTVRMVALDGYVIELDRKSWESDCSFVATRYQQQEITVEKKGPTRLLFPCLIKTPDHDDTPTSDWIWNLKEIHIEN
ncbi:MAG: molybdopterin-dependent oxidoreductase [Halopseudomonas aestusnigri]